MSDSEDLSLDEFYQMVRWIKLKKKANPKAIYEHSQKHFDNLKNEWNQVN